MVFSIAMTCIVAADIGTTAQDPGADGPVIQAASTRALSAGTNLDRVLAMLAGVAPSMRAPVLIFTYYNPIMARGLDKFCRQAKDAGVSGTRLADDRPAKYAASRRLPLACWRAAKLLTQPARPGVGA